MKYLNILTSQSLGLIFTDQRGRIIDPKTIDIDVSLYAGNSGANVKFSAKNGVFTNCIDRNHGIAATIEPNQLQSGQLYADYTLNIANSDYSSGVQLIHDVQLLDITIVSKFVGVQQSQSNTTYSVLVLDSVCMNEKQIYKPDGADETWVKREVDNYMLNYSANILKPDLSNVNKTAFDGEVANSQTITDIRSELGNYAFSDLSNVPQPSKELFINSNPNMLKEKHAEGVYCTLTSDEFINSKYSKSRLFFGNTIVRGGSMVYSDLTSNSFVIQDINLNDDPNISGGSVFVLAANFDPARNPQPITQQGRIKFVFCDDNDVPLVDINGNICASEVNYSAGDVPRKEVLISIVRATTAKKIHLKIELDFTNEEIITIGAGSGVCVQSVTNGEAMGMALLAFMLQSGYRFKTDTRYYGYNLINLSRALTFDEPQINTTGNTYFGGGLRIHTNNNNLMSIRNYRLEVQDDGRVLPIFNLSKDFDKIDARQLSNKLLKLKIAITNKHNAFDVYLLTGGNGEANLLSYQNTMPQWSIGWSAIKILTIDEDATSVDRIISQNVTLPKIDGAFSIALIPRESEVPTSLILKDFEIDVIPAFNFIHINNLFHIDELTEVNENDATKFKVSTPKGYAEYRWTANSSNTNVPLGLGGNVVFGNNHSWKEMGAFDPDGVQGDLIVNENATLHLSYSVLACNKKASSNSVTIFLAKNESGGAFTQIPQSVLTTTIKANQTTPIKLYKGVFDVVVNKGDTFRMFMRSNIDDGFYLFSKDDGKPLFELKIVADVQKYVPIESLPNKIEITENGVIQNSSDYIISIDADTSVLSVKKK